MKRINEMKDDVMRNLKDNQQQFDVLEGEYKTKVDTKAALIREMIDNFHGIYEYYHEKHLFFITYNKNIRSLTGPVLSYDEDLREMIEYNVAEKFIQATKLNYEFKPIEEPRRIRYEDLINKANFDDIYESLIINTKLYEYYIDMRRKSLIRLEAELEKYNEKLNSCTNIVE